VRSTVDVWIYLDESGTVDFNPSASNSPYFAFGSASTAGDHLDVFRGYLIARASRNGVENGFHAYNDSAGSKQALFDVMRESDLEFASTFMAKANADPDVVSRPKVWFYKHTLFLHLGAVIPKVSRPGDIVHVVAAHISMDAKRDAVIHAVEDVCSQVAWRRTVVAHIWKSPTSAGLQMADYALWATQRKIVQGKQCSWYDNVVRPKERFNNFPWGTSGGQLSR
jgi:hypothetical protein